MSIPVNPNNRLDTVSSPPATTDIDPQHDVGSSDVYAIGQSLPTTGPAIAQSCLNYGFKPVPLCAPVYGDKKTGKNPSINGGDWWSRDYELRQFEGRNVGIRTGCAYGDGYLLVLDPDGAAGLAKQAAIEAQHGALPQTFTVCSGSGVGKHIYLVTSQPFGGCNLAPHVNTRGVGGQVVAPDNWHYSGGQYVIEVNVPIARAPAWLENLLRKPSSYQRSPVDPKLYPAIELTAEMCAQRANELGPSHRAYDVFRALANGTPLAASGERHDRIDLRAMKVLVGEFGPGITDESVLALIAPAYPAWSRNPLGPGSDYKNWIDAINGLRGAKEQHEPARFSDASITWAKSEVQRIAAPVAGVPEVPLAAPVAAAPEVPAVLDAAFRLTVEHCRERAEIIGRRTSNGAGQEKAWWRSLALDTTTGILRADVPAVLQMIYRAYPTADVESVVALLQAHNVGPHDEIRVAAARAQAALSAVLARGTDRLEVYERAKILLNESDHPLPTAANIISLVRACLGRCLRLNVRKLAIECRDLPWDKRGEWRDWNEASDTAALICWLQNEHTVLQPVGAYDAVVAAAEAKQVDPFIEWFEALSQWDGTPRLDTWLVRAAGCEDGLYTRAIGAKFILSIIARTALPGCKVDTKLVLVGGQGTNKSTLLGALVPPAMFDSTPKDPREPLKDYLCRLHRFVLHEDAEMDSYSQSDVKADKALITNRVDSFRKPYAKSTATFERRFVLCGSTNDEDGFLRDTTGGRRYWPVRIGTVDVPWMRANVAQLWAEALVRFSPFMAQVFNDNELPQDAYAWWLTPEEDAAAEVVQEEHRARDPFEERLDAKLRTAVLAELSATPCKEQFETDDQLKARLQAAAALNPPKPASPRRLLWVTAGQVSAMLDDKCSPDRASKLLRSLGWTKMDSRRGRLPNGAQAQKWCPPAGWTEVE